MTSEAVHYRVRGPTQSGTTASGHEVHEGRRQTDRRSAHAGSRLKLIDVSGRSRLICQPSSRTGENSPYGMIGGIEETSASFEARSAPRSYPTKPDECGVLEDVDTSAFEAEPTREEYCNLGRRPYRRIGVGNGGVNIAIRGGQQFCERCYCGDE